MKSYSVFTVAADPLPPPRSRPHPFFYREFFVADRTESCGGSLSQEATKKQQGEPQQATKIRWRGWCAGRHACGASSNARPFSARFRNGGGGSVGGIGG